MLNQELLDYFKRVEGDPRDDAEKEFASRMVRNLSYAVETEWKLGQKWRRKYETPNKQASVTANVDLSEKRQVMDFAKERGVSVNRIVRRALLEHMEANRWMD
jgi:hypothetical protein